MTVTYHGDTFDLTWSQKLRQFFGRSGHRELYIGREMLANFIERGVMTIQTSGPGRHEYDERRVVSATCDICHFVHDRVPAKRPKCSVCQREGCPECFEDGAFSPMDYCEMCDSVICKDCWRASHGYKICMQVVCRDKACEEATKLTLEKHEREKKDQRHPLRRTA